MAELSAETLPAAVAGLRLGSVVAAAGCGKTELIARATAAGVGRRLILTHTHAGVDVLRRRLRDHGVSSRLYLVDTIAGWSLRYASAYRGRSGLTLTEPRTDSDWTAVYAAATRLIRSGAVKRVLSASYSGLFVDEYQDCGASQHAVVVALSESLSTCLFGDPMQAIFDFKGQTPVDWDRDVFPRFTKLCTLSRPHRWIKHNNEGMATWLKQIRTDLERGAPVDFGNLPDQVRWTALPDEIGQRHQKVVGACLTAMGRLGDLVVIADPANLEGRAKIASKLAKQGFSNIEPVDCKTAYALMRRLGSLGSSDRLGPTLDVIEKCMGGVERAAFDHAISSRKRGGSLGTAKFGDDLIGTGLALAAGGSDALVLALIDAFAARPTSFVYRREMLRAIRASLRMKIADDCTDLTEGLWRAQNQARHAGRPVPHRAVGSTLLVKGLEFANAVVIHSDSMSGKDWYVALTRATHTLTVLSPLRRFQPAA